MIKYLSFYLSVKVFTCTQELLSWVKYSWSEFYVLWPLWIYYLTLSWPKRFLPRNLLLTLLGFPCVWWLFLNSCCSQNSLLIFDIQEFDYIVSVKISLGWISLRIFEFHVSGWLSLPRFWKLSAIISLFSDLFSTLSRTPIAWILFHLMVSHYSHRFSLLFFMFISFFSSKWIISRGLSSCSWILSSAWLIEPIIEALHCIFFSLHSLHTSALKIFYDFSLLNSFCYCIAFLSSFCLSVFSWISRHFLKTVVLNSSSGNS